MAGTTEPSAPLRGAARLDAMLEEYDKKYGKGGKDKFHDARMGKARKMLLRQDELIALFAANPEWGLKKTLQAAGISYHTYTNWRRDNPKFKERIDKAKEDRLGFGVVSMSPEDLPAHRRNFTDFRKRYFEYDTYYHQARIIKAIEEAKPSEIVMVLCPPEHGKTSVLEDYINFKLAIDPNFRITYVHESQRFAQKVLRKVTNRMTDVMRFPEYAGAFGPFYEDGQERSGKPWTANHITVAKSNHDERDYSLQAMGWSSKVQGTRTDLLLIDDVQALGSLNQTEKIAETLRQDFFSRPGKDGKIVMVGTRVGVNDIYEYFLKDPGLSKLIKLVQMPAMDGQGKSLCPEMWDEKALETKRTLVGEDAWWRNYMQQPLQAGSQTFMQDMIDACHDETIQACDISPGIPVVLGVDPSLGGGNAIIAAGYSRKEFRLIDARKDWKLGRTEQIIDIIADFAARYRPEAVVIEINAFQRGLARDERLLKLAKMYGFRIQEHATSNSKHDPILGVASMAGSFIREEIRIPFGTQMAAARFEALENELISWRPDVKGANLEQDLVMAMWFAWKYWTERRRTMNFNTENWNFKGLN